MLKKTDVETIQQNRLPNFGDLRQEILESYRRSHQYGIDPNWICNPLQVHLSLGELTDRIEQNRTFFDVAKAQIRELYQLVAGAGFVMALVDCEGYLLEIVGDSPQMEESILANLSPGYRWTEQDVGTTAISLALASEIPVQLDDADHYCKRGHGDTSTAAPIFDAEGGLLGILAMAGDVEQIHPHTLGMVITAARAIESQLRIIRGARELLIQNNYMNALIESIDSGVIAANRDGVITQINKKGELVLHWGSSLIGKSLNDLFGTQVNWEKLIHSEVGYVDREIFIRSPYKTVQLIYTAKSISDSDGLIRGIIIIFNEIDRVRKLVNSMAGSQARFVFEDIIGHGQAIGEAKRLALLAAAGSSTVLLLGETGTGKELFAQAIHNQSERKGQPFVAINCGAIPRELLESELFGYAEGAFTGARKGGCSGKFELADGGTVFLDEIGDMPSDMQVKLLRVLQTGEVTRIGQHKPVAVNLRIIAATHVNLIQEVEKKTFRSDLFYRINVFPIRIPPLRERAEDLVLLAKHILGCTCRMLDKTCPIFSPEAESMLFNYDWPGNVRELGNILERVATLVVDNVIEAQDIEPHIPQKSGLILMGGEGDLLVQIEKRTINEVLNKVEFNIAKAAKILGISRVTLYKKIKDYSLSEQHKIKSS